MAGTKERYSMTEHKLKLPLSADGLLLDDANQNTVAVARGRLAEGYLASKERACSIAAQLAHAANCHDELVGACRSALQIHDDSSRPYFLHHETYERMAAALAKEEKEPTP